MQDCSVRAEWDPLTAVRVHTPGIELWSNVFDPEANLFEDIVAPEQARIEHEMIVSSLREAGVEVHHLADDLEKGGPLNELVRESFSSRERSGCDSINVDRILESFSPHEKLECLLARPSLISGGNDELPPSVKIEQPISNMFFQRDTTILGDKGPVLCNMYEPIRQAEVPIVRDAWEAVGADIAYEMESEPVEGGEFLPLGEFALLGVSAKLDGEEHIIRTSYNAGRELMENDAINFDEFGLVRAPLKEDRRLREQHDAGSRVLHLLGWFNVVSEDLAVLDVDLAQAADVDVYVKTQGTYEKDRTMSFFKYITDEKGFDYVDISWSERWPTNFLTVESNKILPLYETNENGEYQPENNPTIESLKELGVEILGGGTGIPQKALTKGGGGIHCMTTPISRERP